MYHKGIGVPKNRDLAIMWLQKAKDCGQIGAGVYLKAVLKEAE